MIPRDPSSTVLFEVVTSCLYISIAANTQTHVLDFWLFIFEGRPLIGG